MKTELLLFSYKRHQGKLDTVFLPGTGRGGGQVMAETLQG